MKCVLLDKSIIKSPVVFLNKMSTLAKKYLFADCFSADSIDQGNILTAPRKKTIKPPPVIPSLKTTSKRKPVEFSIKENPSKKLKSEMPLVVAPPKPKMLTPASLTLESYNYLGHDHFTSIFCRQFVNTTVSQTVVYDQNWNPQSITMELEMVGENVQVRPFDCFSYFR